MHRLTWSKKRPRYKRSDQENYSTSAVLRKQKKSSDELEMMVSCLTLEELICLKLEISARETNNKLYGFDLWKKIPVIAKEAVFRYAYSGTRTRNELAAFLGLARDGVDKLFDTLKPHQYFSKKK